MTTEAPIDFYFGSGSPYAWKVWLALEHKQLRYSAKRMTFDGGELKSAEFTAINPRQKVPALFDNGFAVAESAAILEYLEDQYPDRGAPLWPRAVTARAVARQRAAEIVSYIDPLNGMIFDMVFGEASKAPDSPAMAEWKLSMAAQLAIIETWLEADYLAGAQLSATDFTLYPYVAFLGRIDSRKPGLDLRSLLPPKLAAWMKRIEALPYFEKTYPPHWKA
jgi:glutathione S-transferase